MSGAGAGAVGGWVGQLHPPEYGTHPNIDIGGWGWLAGRAQLPVSLLLSLPPGAAVQKN